MDSKKLVILDNYVSVVKVEVEKIANSYFFSLNSDESDCDSVSLSEDDEWELVTKNVFEKKESDYDKALKSLLNHFIKLSLECLENTAKIMNAMPGATVQLPTSKYKLTEAFFSLSTLSTEYHIFCDRCKIYIKFFPLNEWKCANCSNKLQKSETNHFTYIRLEEQLKHTLTKNWASVV